MTPAEILKVDMKQFATLEIKNKRAEAEKERNQSKRSDWEAEQIKAKGDKHQGIFVCIKCGSNKTDFV